MSEQSFWIKERNNPQLKRPYYVALGQLSRTAARKHEKSLYGDNFMHEYRTVEDYAAKLEILRARGETVQ